MSLAQISAKVTSYSSVHSGVSGSASVRMVTVGAPPLSWCAQLTSTQRNLPSLTCT
uniref:Uncharacterized protein n=1 Tax=Arundo donax TaxID=35708 RepID=A0A0A9FB03_ARUDO